MFNTIFKKFFISFLVSIVISFSVLGLILNSFLGSYAIKQKEIELNDATRKVSQMTVRLFTNYSVTLKDYYQLLIDSMAQNNMAYIIVAGTSGEITFISSNLSLGIPIYSIPQDALTIINSGKDLRTMDTFGGVFKKKALIIGVPVKFNNDIVAGVYVISDVPELSRLKSDVFAMYLYAVLVTFLISFSVAFILSKKISDPVKEINKFAKRLTKGDFKERVSISTNDEIGHLAETFNEMASALEQLENMRRVFISDVSHELRTPMTTITGFVEGILDDTIPKEKQDIYLKIVLDETKRLSKLVNNLLDISRLSSESSSLELSTFDINELLKISIISFEKRINEKELTITASFENENEYVIAEKDSIKRVATNLIDNAIKFSDVKGNLEIKTKRVGNLIHISIKNTGVGVSEEEKKTIFERFYQHDKSRNTNKIGVGLGLYIVKSIINKHNQQIWVDSVPGEYAKFTFTLLKSPKS